MSVIIVLCITHFLSSDNRIADSNIGCWFICSLFVSLSCVFSVFFSAIFVSSITCLVNIISAYFVGAGKLHFTDTFKPKNMDKSFINAFLVVFSVNFLLCFSAYFSLSYLLNNDFIFLLIFLRVYVLP